MHYYSNGVACLGGMSGLSGAILASPTPVGASVASTLALASQNMALVPPMGADLRQEAYNRASLASNAATAFATTSITRVEVPPSTPAIPSFVRPELGKSGSVSIGAPDLEGDVPEYERPNPYGGGGDPDPEYTPTRTVPTPTYAAPGYAPSAGGVVAPSDATKNVLLAAGALAALVLVGPALLRAVRR